jgi:sporulation protein YlmC with PRC-barrel domain
MMDSLVTTIISEADRASEIYNIVNTLVKEGRVLGNPEDIRIERVNREPVLPCRRGKDTNTLNLEQLEWAAKKGEFWFLGPIKSLKINLGKGKVQETLVSELDRLILVTTINGLNYEDLQKIKDEIIKLATESGFQVKFSQPDKTHNIKVSISTQKPMTEGNVKEFLKGIEKVRKAI